MLSGYQLTQKYKVNYTRMARSLCSPIALALMRSCGKPLAIEVSDRARIDTETLPEMVAGGRMGQPVAFDCDEISASRPAAPSPSRCSTQTVEE